MEEFIINESNELADSIELKLIHKPDLSDRKGYDKTFLGIHLPLPTFKVTMQTDLAINQQPTENGKYFLDYSHYSVLFNKKYKLPVVTAVNIQGKTNELAMVHEQRGSDKWFQDNRIKVGDHTFQFGDDDYRASQFHKGHMVRYYDPAWDEDKEKKKIAMGDTFYYTNCCPQLPGLNTGIWNDLEDFYMAKAIFQDERVSVFSGPIFTNAVIVEKLLVPLNFWKVIVYKRNGSLEALGYIISHQVDFQKSLMEQFVLEERRLVKPTLKEEDIAKLFERLKAQRWQVKISEIEKKTGLKFGVNDADESKDEGVGFFKRLAPIQKESLLKERFLERMNQEILTREEYLKDRKFLDKI